MSKQVVINLTPAITFLIALAIVCMPVAPTRSLAQDPTIDGVDPKLISFARRMLSRYDDNKNGVLDREEWDSVPGDAASADRNGDRRVTIDELAYQLGANSRDRAGGWGSDPHRRRWSNRSAATSGPVKSGTHGSYRFLSAWERMPEGLPAWFSRNDADGDGQILMCEYATIWSDAKVAEFGQFDLNGDGVITPQECLAATTGD